MPTFSPIWRAIETQFHHLVRTLPASGLIVSNAAEASLERVLQRGCWTPVERFNAPEGYRVTGDDASGELILHGPMAKSAVPSGSCPASTTAPTPAPRCSLPAMSGVPLDKGLEALSRFEQRQTADGSTRRSAGVTVYDDFAHHPTAIATTVAGLRRKVGKARILAVLEPRSNTMKLGTMKSQLAGSLSEVDAAFCYAGNLGWDAAKRWRRWANGPWLRTTWSAGRKIVAAAQPATISWS
jgi:UDP-N-acetylmuramate: L-alanyl-gamma-D-glutamyl-meso-diaminopimelate ligase